MTCQILSKDKYKITLEQFWKVIKISLGFSVTIMNALVWWWVGFGCGWAKLNVVF